MEWICITDPFPWGWRRQSEATDSPQDGSEQASRHRYFRQLIDHSVGVVHDLSPDFDQFLSHRR
jgi:hypothetical protein